MKPRALDLYCGGGGAAVGLARAGFEVHGVDLAPQPLFPFAFTQASALDVELTGYDLIWASPPCQRYSTSTRDKSRHADLIGPTRERLLASGIPFIIENVEGAPLRSPLLLCGAMFDLGVIRHRRFECSVPLPQPEHVPHKGSLVTGEYVTVTGKGGVPAWTMRKREERGLPRHFPGESSRPRWAEAMGTPWLVSSQLALVQAIPPAYAEHLGRAFLNR